MSEFEGGAGTSGVHFEIEYRPESVVRFEKDHEEGPVVGFAYDDAGSISAVILEHTIVSHPKFVSPDKRVVSFNLSEPDMLVFTAAEWVQFYSGAKLGDFVDDDTDTQSYHLGDTKNPDAHFFTFSASGFRAFIMAVRSGKYDLPPEQESQILAQRNKNQE